MAIHVLAGPATPEQIADMLTALDDYIKVAVDVERGVLAGGGIMHADCERVLLEHGSRQEDVWGANWYPASKSIGFESLINIRPQFGNRSMEVESPALRECIESVTSRVFANG